MVTVIGVNNGSSNDLLPDSTNPSPNPLLIVINEALCLSQISQKMHKISILKWVWKIRSWNQLSLEPMRQCYLLLIAYLRILTQMYWPRTLQLWWYIRSCDRLPCQRIIFLYVHNTCNTIRWIKTIVVLLPTCILTGRRGVFLLLLSQYIFMISPDTSGIMNQENEEQTFLKWKLETHYERNITCLLVTS